MAALATLLCLMVSYPIAYYISIKVRPSRKNLLLTLVVIPFWTSFLIRTYAWIVMLRTEGWINSFLLGIGIIHEPLPLLFTNYAILVGLVYGELPFMILPLYVSLEKLDLSLLEAAKDLGANSFWTFWKVTVPLTMPGIVAGIVLVFIPSIGAFVVPDLLGGAKGMLVGNLIQNQFLVARNKPFGSAVAFALTAFVLVVLYGYARFAKRRGEALI
jgi:spermidine/putrescine transport system permease protein